MKAIVQLRYGPPGEVLRLQDVARPVPKDGEALVRVRAASVHPDVWHVVTGFPQVLRLMGAGVRRPKNPIPGTDLAGVVESVGSGVTRLKPGDEVLGETVSGYSWANGGAFAEYAPVRESYLALKPPSVSFEAAATVPTAGIIALRSLQREGGLGEGRQRVLVNGAGGGVGMFAVQIAKAFGAEVTGVDRAEKLELIRSLGADHVIDYMRDDFTRGSERYDIILDIPGNHSLSACRRVLNPDGKYVLVGHDNFGRNGHRRLGSLPRMLSLMARSPFVRQLPKATLSMPKKSDMMAVLRDLLETGKLTPVIGRTFPLSEVPEAIRCMEEGSATGRIVITV